MKDAGGLINKNKVKYARHSIADDEIPLQLRENSTIIIKKTNILRQWVVI